VNTFWDCNVSNQPLLTKIKISFPNHTLEIVDVNNVSNVWQSIICNYKHISVIEIHHRSINRQKFNKKAFFDTYFQCNPKRHGAR
jgi:hypothetical protein